MTFKASPSKIIISNTPPSGIIRQFKGNQELNEELILKANELEKLFAQHKLRVSGDQPTPTRQNKVSAAESDQTATRSSYTKQQVTNLVPIDNIVPDELQVTYESFDNARGKLYHSYVKKRNARLTELWDINGLEKEAKMKAMHDRLERHSTQMSTKFSSWSAGRRNSVSSPADRLRSLSARSALKRDELLDFGQLQARTTAAAATPRSTTKLASRSARQRPPPDNNRLAQSVPNLSDLREQNTKPYSAARSQVRNYSRNRCTNEEMPPVKEEKSRRSNSSKKSSEVVAFTQCQKVEPKRFLRKNTGRGPGTVSAVPKMKVSRVSEAMNNVELYESNVVQGDKEKGFGTIETEDQAVVDQVESRSSPESETLMNSESENGNTSQSFSQADHTSAAESPVTVTPLVQNSPGESPISWNSYPYSHTHEAYDVESPMRSPASWNNLQPTEADYATRMRMKWGVAHKPKSFKRLFNFGRKYNDNDNSSDYISATTSEGDDDTEDQRKSRNGYLNGFGDNDYYKDEVHTSQSSIPTPPANFRLREDHMSGSSIKAPRSFFSLSSFRSKGK
ncbi:uncharacterized protein [Rutidosis leptorrhynchoides]|uniref:uncharacterized protein n=1 Tax=Rutidosis leptorrhynchoides TaxID=125765 RepID=UPI003A999F39